MRRMRNKVTAQKIADVLASLFRSLRFDPDYATALSWGGLVLVYSGKYFLFDAERHTDLLKLLQSQYGVIAQQSIEKNVQEMLQGLLKEIIQAHDFKWDRDFRLSDISHSLVEQSRLLSATENLLEKLSASIREYTVFVPLTGIELPIPNYNFGPVVLFRTEDSPPVVEAADLLPDNIFGRLREAPCVVRVQIEGDAEFARQDGMRQANQLAAILNLHLAIWSLDTDYQKIRCADILSPSVAIVLARTNLPNDNGILEPVYLQGVYNRGFNKPTVDSTLLNSIKGNGFDFLWECLNNKNPSNDELRKRVRRAVMWLDKSVKFDEIDAQFVGFATALEVLLVSRGSASNIASTWGSITQQLADRCAFLLGHDLKSTMEIARRVKKLYGTRSKIVHSGEQPTTEDLLDLAELTSNIILNFVQRGFSSFEHFETWIRHIQYSVNLDEINRFQEETN